MADADIKNQLAAKIHQFFSHEIEENPNLSEAAKESLTVAAECIEQAFKFARSQPSSELVDIYRQHISSQSNAGSNNSQQPQNPNDLLRMFEQIAPNLNMSALFNQFAGAMGGAAAPRNSQQEQQQQDSSSSSTTFSAAPKDRRQPNEAEKKQAEVYKTQGNECMKQERFQEACELYTKAIELDGCNAVYYSNRAAGLSKLGDHQGALKDCQEAVEIDPAYSKAYGRMGLAYVSLNDHQKAKDAYLKAVELDPENESYRNNLHIAEEKLRTGNSGEGGQDALFNQMRRAFDDPQGIMNALQNPAVQNTLRTFCNIGLQQFGNMNPNNNDQQPPPGNV